MAKRKKVDVREMDKEEWDNAWQGAEEFRSGGWCMRPLICYAGGAVLVADCNGVAGHWDEGVDSHAMYLHWSVTSGPVARVVMEALAARLGTRRKADSYNIISVLRSFGFQFSV